MRLHPGPGNQPAGCPCRHRSLRRPLFLEPLEDRSLLAGGLSPTLVALGGATPLPIQLRPGYEANPFGGPDLYQNFPGPADTDPGVSPLLGNEPSQIRDFDGAYGGARVQGSGISTEVNGTHRTLLWDADLCFMQGVYRGLDGNFYRGTIVEVRLDLYSIQSDLESLSNQLHDFNVGMGPDVGNVPGGNNFGTRVFWTAVVPDGDVHVDPAAGTAQLHVRDLPALDYPEDFAGGSLGPNWQTAYVPATVSFDILWSRPVTRQVTVNDAADQFAGTFDENRATVIWSAQSASGFRFNARAGNAMTSTPGAPDITTTYFFAEVGHEQNGIFFPRAPSPASIAGALAASSITPPASPTTSPPPPANPAAASAGTAQANQPAAAPASTPAASAHVRAVDNLFAGLHGRAPADALRGDLVPAELG
jgi:hypothetical protein